MCRYFLVVERVLGEIRMAYTDARVNAVLASCAERPAGAAYTRHFTQAEDFFIRLPEPFEVPSFPIHHDVRIGTPSTAYLDALVTFLDGLTARVPGIFAGLSFMFDPAEILRPCFFQVFRVGGLTYLYLLRLDLVFRPHRHTAVKTGTNDRTAVYQTRDLLVEVDIVPLTGISSSDGHVTGFRIRQMISDTWIGETGRGYFVQGIWLDQDLTKFFSKVFVPTGKRIYPWYPFTSKFRTVCHTPLGIEAPDRRRGVPLLHRAVSFLEPHLERIQSDLRAEEFSESMALYTTLRGGVEEEWERVFAPVTVRRYLNDEEMREYEIEDRG